jgi:glycosyltransferase involved in cell wall biosynthesis
MTDPHREAPPIVVHSHLRWSGIWQRPQQIHSRLAAKRAVTFVEEPIEDVGTPRLDIGATREGVVVLQPRLSPAQCADGASAERAVVAMLRDAAGGRLGSRLRHAVHWLYTPAMEPQIDAVSDPVAIVYDCMDELTQFLHAPRGLAERERALLARSDVVFAGGPALFEAKVKLHRDVHLFGCGVDFDHFHRAASPAERIPADLETIAPPRLGYVGAVDERLDYDLLARMARAHPEWSIVLVGPVVKVDRDALPRESNVHWLGSRPYEELPSYLAGFAACLMPFALNAATEFINPTKTLEYLATGKPIVATPVRDVARFHSDVLAVADRTRFVGALEAVLAGAAPDREAGLERARRASWDGIVSRMEEAIRGALRAKDSAPTRDRALRESRAATSWTG